MITSKDFHDVNNHLQRLGIIFDFMKKNDNEISFEELKVEGLKSLDSLNSIWENLNEEDFISKN